MGKAIIVDKIDNVIVAIEPIKKGDEAVYVLNGTTHQVIAENDIIIYHKLASKDIRKDEPIIKYGEHIGLASRDIKAGEHVHTHNVQDHREAL
ncbi:MAG: UxaA family hydrolase [Clostridiaceae bacterium]